jgi:hypothetical protein
MEHEPAVSVRQTDGAGGVEADADGEAPGATDEGVGGLWGTLPGRGR